MNFIILPSETKMSVDNAEVEVDTRPWIPSNIEIVVWHGDTGSGIIEFNDRLRISQRTTRLEDYVTPVDAWINTAAAQLGLSVAQAQNIKIDMVEALYQNKRIAPYTNPASGWLYDCSDEAILHMAAAAAAQGVYDRMELELIPATDTAFTNKIAEVSANAQQNNNNAAQVNAWSQQMANNWAGMPSAFSKATYSMTSGATSGWVGGTPPDSAWAAHVHGVTMYRTSYTLVIGNRYPGSGCPHRMTTYNPTSVAAGGGTSVWWEPLSPSGQRQHNAIQFRDLLRNIVIRRIFLNRDRVQKKNEVLAQGSIAAVVAYPVAAGWSA